MGGAGNAGIDFDGETNRRNIRADACFAVKRCSWYELFGDGVGGMAHAPNLAMGVGLVFRKRRKYALVNDGLDVSHLRRFVLW